MGSRSVRDAYINGNPTRVGYFGQGRIAPEYRSGPTFGASLRLLRQLQKANPVDYSYAIVAASNRVMRQICDRPSAMVPQFRRRGDVSTLAIVPPRARRLQPPPGLVLRRAQRADLADVAGLLQGCYRPLQYAPVWQADDLVHPERCRGLQPEDFWLAMRGKRLVGCLALWDQRAFKQTVVRAMSPLYHLARPLLGAISPWVAVPTIAKIGEVLNQAYVSHTAVESDDPAVWLALVAAVAADARDRGIAYAVLCLGSAHPICALIARHFVCLRSFHIELATL
jgi:hypothetical protein